ncbi:MAG: hypothetical protein ACRD29_14605, partial [Acidimicrobiales bacterium]
MGPQLVPEGVEMAASCRAVACRNSCQMAFSSGSSEPSADEPEGVGGGSGWRASTSAKSWPNWRMALAAVRWWVATWPNCALSR